MNPNQSPEKQAANLLRQFLDRGGPKIVERIEADENWLTATGSLPSFTAPTLFLGIKGNPPLLLDRATCSLSAGSALFVNQGVLTRTYAPRGEGAWIGLRLDSRPFTIYGQGPGGNDLAAAMSGIEEWPHFRQLRRVYELLTRPDVREHGGEHELIRLLVHQILLAIAIYPWRGGSLPGMKRELHSPSIVSMAGLEFCALFVDRKLQRSDVAHGIGISESYLATVLSSHLDTNLTDYLAIRRMTHADRLLLAGSASIAEIAELCGFTSANYFIRAFRRLRAKTPLQIRKLARKPALTPEETSELFHYTGFERLSPFSEPEAQAAHGGTQPIVSRAIMVANSKPEPVFLDLALSPGQYFEVCAVPSLNVHLTWNLAPALWRVRSANQLASYFVSGNRACQILV